MIGIIKTLDKRYDYLYEFLNKEVIYSDDIHSFFQIDTLIIPPLGADYLLFFKHTNISLNEIFLQNPYLKTIVTGLKSKELIAFCETHNIKLLSFLDDEEVVRENAKFTAEACIRLMSEKLDCSLKDLSILILGYGNISYYLNEMLNIYDSNVTIYSKDATELKLAKLSKIKVLEEIDDLSHFDCIINTIPKTIMNKENLDTILTKQILIELASYPYGINIEYLKQKNNEVLLYQGLPGKVVPKSGAKLIYNFLKNNKIN